MQYLIESPHTKEECLSELDALAEKGKELDRWSWGCMSGEHTGYAIVEADSETAARDLIPTAVRGKARIHPVTRFTPKDVQKFHQT
jgi:hypothetical protein